MVVRSRLGVDEGHENVGGGRKGGVGEEVVRRRCPSVSLEDF